LASYIEKMGKSNDQLIRLSELISKAEKANDAIDPDELFKRIEGQ